jgi:hypothetical protein
MRNVELDDSFFLTEFSLSSDEAFDGLVPVLRLPPAPHPWKLSSLPVPFVPLAVLTALRLIYFPILAPYIQSSGLADESHSPNAISA